MAKKTVNEIMFNAHTAIRALIDKYWESASSIGDKQFNALDAVRNARSALEDIDSFQTRRIADQECQAALELTFDEYLKAERKDWEATGKKKLHIYHYLKQLQQAHKLLQAVKEDS